MKLSAWTICRYEGRGSFCTLKFGLTKVLNWVQISEWWGKVMLCCFAGRGLRSNKVFGEMPIMLVLKQSSRS